MTFPQALRADATCHKLRAYNHIRSAQAAFRKGDPRKAARKLREAERCFYISGGFAQALRVSNLRITIAKRELRS